MKKFKNRKYVKNVKNVNNAVKNNANMDGYEELVKAAKEFNGALDDEVANREYERKKLAETKEFKELMELQEEALRSIGGFSEVIIHSLEPWGRAMTYGELYRQETAKTAMQAVEDIINPVTEEKREKSKKNKPASEVESLKAELENLNAHFKGVCAERDNLAACLKSAENALAYKDKMIAVLNNEIEFQYKRREKAEKFVNTLGQAFDLLKKNVEDYEHSIGR